MGENEALEHEQGDSLYVTEGGGWSLRDDPEDMSPLLLLEGPAGSVRLRLSIEQRDQVHAALYAGRDS